LTFSPQKDAAASFFITRKTPQLAIQGVGCYALSDGMARYPPLQQQTYSAQAEAVIETGYNPDQKSGTQ
jgi:hypothetical protein